MAGEKQIIEVFQQLTWVGLCLKNLPQDKRQRYKDLLQDLDI